MSAPPNIRHLSHSPGCSLKGGIMKLSQKIKMNWKPPELADNKKLSQNKLLQDQINAELNEMSTMITEWYVER